MKRGLIILSTSLLLVLFTYIVSKNASSPNFHATEENEFEKEEHLEELLKWEFQLLRNSKTGKIPADAGERELEVSAEMNARAWAMKMNPDANIHYSFQGPANMAGRIRALCFDKNDLSGNTVLVGGVSGALFKSIDGGSTWTKINLPGQRHYTITTITQDPRTGFGNVWYCAGGAEIFGGTPVLDMGVNGHFGDGVFKSVDNGNTWFRLFNSNNGLYNQFDRPTDNIHSIIIHPLNGDIYLACTSSIVRSTDGGITWADVLNDHTPYFTTFNVSEVCINSLGKIFAAFNVYSIDEDVKGIWTSVTGDVGSWTKLMNGGSPAPDSIQYASRVKMELDYDGEGILILFSNTAAPNSCPPRSNLFRYKPSANSFTQILLPDCSTSEVDRFNAQGGYNLCVLAMPGKPDTIFVGGTNLYRTVDGGESWQQIGGYFNLTNTDARDSHPDFHSLKFSPANNNILFCTNDGGIQKGDIHSPVVDWIPLNNSLPTYQYYHVTLNPNAGVNHFIGGSQDNGTSSSHNNDPNHTTIFSGDGVSVGIGKSGPPYKEYIGIQNGVMFRRRSDMPSGSYEGLITPLGIQSRFITKFYLDPDNTEYLYFGGNLFNDPINGKLLRLKDASTAPFPANWEMFNFNFFGYLVAFTTTRGSYDPATSKLYVTTDVGYIYRISDPANAPLSVVPENITPPGVIGLVCPSISVNPLNPNEIIAVYASYNDVSIWHSLNAGATWSNAEGNLSYPSFRTCKIVIIDNQPQYFIGTSIGLFRAAQLSGSQTIWNQEAVDLIGNALVVDLAYRPEDNVLLIGTHGSGMYKALLSGTSLPITLRAFRGTTDNSNNLLFWTTSQEQNNKGFNIEHSTDATNFSPVGFVAGKGVSYFPANYQFSHSNVFTPVNYYRLKQMDFDGSFSYSKTIVLKHRNSLEVQLLENPSRNSIHVQIKGADRLSVVVQLYNMAGIPVLTKQIAQANGRIEIPVQSLPPGQYICSWRFSNTVVINNKIIISK